MEDDYDVHEERRRVHERRKGRNHSPTSNADNELKYTLDPINSARKSRNITPRMKKYGSGHSQGRPRLDSQLNSLTNTNRDTVMKRDIITSFSINIITERILQSKS